MNIDAWSGAPAAVAVLHVTHSAGALGALLAELDPSAVSAVLWSTGLAPTKEAESFDIIERAGFRSRPVVDGEPLLAGAVYLAPAGHKLWFEGSCMRLALPSMHEGASFDRVLQSLARAWGRRSIVLALAPLGADGERGLYAVRRAGGAVRIACGSGSDRAPASSPPSERSPESEAPASRTAPRSQRPSVPPFRVQRWFPRSPLALGRLQAAVALAVQRAATRDRVRVWVPACRTGGLVQVVAMLLCGAIAAADSGQRAQVFGTDPDEEALGVARAGRYPEGVAAGMDARLRALYLLDDGDGRAGSVLVSEALREVCFFSSHKLPRRGPFSRIDLIVCQRVFEGIAPSQRDDVVSELWGALREGGVLFTLDHVQHFENGCFERAVEGHLERRPARLRARSQPLNPSDVQVALATAPWASTQPPPCASTAAVAQIELEAGTDRSIVLRHQHAAVAQLGALALGGCRLSELCEEALSLIVADRPVHNAGLIVECRREAPLLSVVASRGLGADPLEALREAGSADELLQRVAERDGTRGQPLERAERWGQGAVAARRSLERISEPGAFGSAPRLSAGAAWPLVSQGVVLGVIALFSARSGVDVPELQHFMQGIAHVLAAAIERERMRQRLEFEREVDAVVASAGDLAALGRGLQQALAAALAAEALEIWRAVPEDGSKWQRFFPVRGCITTVPPWPSELLASQAPLHRAAFCAERPRELWLPVPLRKGGTVVLRASGVALRAPERELEAGLEAVARRLAPFLERLDGQQLPGEGEVLSETTRRRALAELEALCESLPDGIAIYDHFGALRHGIHFGSEPWLARLYADELPAWIARVVDTGEAIQELELSVLSGAERRSWLCSIRPLHAEGGARSGAIVVVHQSRGSIPPAPCVAPHARAQSSIEPRRRRVLIIASDATDTIALARSFDPAQYAVETAARVDDASLGSTHEGPDVILCEIDSPVIDAATVAKQVRAQGGAGQLALIALTRDSGALARLRAEDAGFDDYLTHPVKPDTLIACLSRLSAAPRFVQVRG